MASASSMLDIAFAMDCTSSMGSYIESAKNNIRSIIDEITTKEHLTIRLALIEYRDHPPEDTTFVTRTHGFTNNVTEMKGWLDQSSALGGGDAPEAVADALNDALNLSWGSEAAKICILISDAPPHGLNPTGDNFPSGCPAGFDPMTIARKMTEKSITLYVVGVEPPIVPYREFFMALAHITGGQYVPMVDATRLAQMIIAGVREEISLNRVMTNSRSDIVRVMRRATKDGVDDLETATRLQRTLEDKKVRVNRMNNTAGIPSKEAEECYSKCTDMADMQRQYKLSSTSSATKPTNLDYKLEEETGVTLEQSKRIVQKAKTWKYDADEPTQSNRPVPCKYGDSCYDFNSHHRAKFEHPSNIPSLSQRTSANQATSRSIRSTHSTRTPCKYGSECFDHSRNHQDMFSHPSVNNNMNTPSRNQQNSDDDSDDHRTRFSHANNNSRRTTTECRYGENCRDNSDEHRARFSHASNNTSSRRTAACRYGDDCRDHSDEHRRKFSHPDD